MNVALWIIQGLLAIAFGMGGFMKLTQPKEKLSENMGWVNDFKANQVKIIGALELSAAVGLILPAALDILVFLTPLAALGLVCVMLGAIYTHYRRNEMPMIGVNTVLGALALFVVVGRFFIEPFN